MAKHLPNVVLLAALNTIYLWPLPVAPRSYLLAAEDTANMLWQVAWGARQIVRDPGHLYDGNIFAPYPSSFAYTDTALGLGPISIPLYNLTADPVLTYNVCLYASFLLTTLATYLLALALVDAPLPALFAAVALGFSSYRRWNIDTVNLCALMYLPLALWSLRRAAIAAREGLPKFRWLALFAVCFALNSLCSFYYLFMLATAMPFFVLPELRRGSVPRTLLPLVAGCVAALALTIPGAIPYLRLNRTMPGFVRTLDEVKIGSAELRDYLAPDPAATLRRARDGFAKDRPVHRGPEPAFAKKIFMSPLPLFPGAVLLAAVALSFLHGRASIAWRLSLLGLAATGVVFSLGPVTTIAGREIPTPYMLLYRFAPGWQGIRWVSRFSLLLDLSFALLGAFGIDAVMRRLGARRRMAATVAIGASLLLFVEKLTLPLHLTAVSGAIPPVYRWVETLPADAILAEVPVTRRGLFTYYAAIHFRRTASGMSSWVPGPLRELHEALGSFPSRGVWEKCRREGITHVLVRYGHIRQPAARQQMRAAAGESPLFREAAAFSDELYGDDIVYEVLGPGRPSESP